MGRRECVMSRSGSMILCYHRVAKPDANPFVLCVTPENFASHLDEVVQHGEPSTLDELAMPSRRPRVVVTLDDGYADNLTNALPIAKAKGVPITVFVTSGTLDGKQLFWWDRLGTLLASRPPAVKEIRLPLADGVVVGSPWGQRGPARTSCPFTVTSCRCRCRRFIGFWTPCPTNGGFVLLRRQPPGRSHHPRSSNWRPPTW